MTVKEKQVLFKLAEYVEDEFIPHETWIQLLRTGDRNELTEKDLPKAFAKLKRMMLGRDASRNNPRLEKQLADQTAEQAKVKRNLRLVDPRSSFRACKTDTES